MVCLPFTLPFTLRRFFRDRVDPAEASVQLDLAIRTRETRFLELVRSRVYGEPSSPYRRLLEHAGCTLVDLERGLTEDGLDETLTKLAGEGVYLTPDEFKGKTDTVRGSLSFRVHPGSLAPTRVRNAPPSFVTQSSGSSNRPVRSVTSLAWQMAETPAMGVFLAAHGLMEHRHAIYEPLLAGVAAGVQAAVMVARLGVPIERWFARPVPIRNRLEAAYFWTTAQQLALSGSWFGPGFARPETVPPTSMEPILRWVETCRNQGQPTCIRTVASNAARIARAAISRGASLSGCTFIASGEPLTPAKRRVIAASGAAATVGWGYEPGPVWVGFGCADPAHSDEMHVLTHTLAVIEHPEMSAVTGSSTVRPLLFTTLHPAAALLQINVSNGDFATLTRRECGCSMQKAGMDLHVHDVGSFEKLTTEGLAYSFQTLYELLETTLPGEFGGGPGDYQILEEEARDGRNFLTLVVDPAVGTIDEGRLIERLVQELASGSRSRRFMTEVWKEANVFRVRRAPPVASTRGKVLPIRISRKDSG